MEFKPEYDFGDEVRLTRNVRNDGTYPGMEIGDFLVKRGSTGHVLSVGTFLQDQLIYTVHFMDDENDLKVGCRGEELIPIDAPWDPAKYEFRDKVVSTRQLAINGEIIVELGEEGEVLKAFKEPGQMATYHVRFSGKTLLVPESCLDYRPSADEDVEPSE
ncbi:MAG: nitrogen fixation protein NifZ [Gammaproteobacteria bacterium]|nr:nitrogen fixation protein NifZ [Gammaproteobacteria bacterium]